MGWRSRVWDGVDGWMIVLKTGMFQRVEYHGEATIHRSRKL